MTRFLSLVLAASIMMQSTLGWAQESPSITIESALTLFMAASNQRQVQVASEQLADVIIDMSRKGIKDDEIFADVYEEARDLAEEADHSQLNEKLKILARTLRQRLVRENFYRFAENSLSYAGAILLGAIVGLSSARLELAELFEEGIIRGNFRIHHFPEHLQEKLDLTLIDDLMKKLEHLPPPESETALAPLS